MQTDAKIGKQDAINLVKQATSATIFLYLPTFKTVVVQTADF